MVQKYPGQKIIYVYENWSAMQPVLMGKLFAQQTKQGEAFSFEYDEAWLKNNKISILDPSLIFYKGAQYTSVNRDQFGIFMDSAPDRWGRMLMNRRERAKQESSKKIDLQESDYLLGVEDFSRMGAIRFALEENGDFVCDDPETKTPPIASLRDLEFASNEYEKDKNFLNEKWIKILLAPGSSLGGARPKANVIDLDNNLWIGKFPSKNDEFDAGAWEYVVHELARLCGLNVPEAKLLKFSSRGSTFLTKRFDRDGLRRIHYASVMTLLEKQDGESKETSYLDIADFIRTYGGNPKADLKELFKRVVFNIAVSNTDDHLRNHGFLLKNNAWELSPLFDVNPNPENPIGLSLNITEDDNALDFGLALKSAQWYGIKDDEADRMIQEISRCVQDNWRLIAKQNHISEKSITYMSHAFRKYR